MGWAGLDAVWAERRACVNGEKMLVKQIVLFCVYTDILGSHTIQEKEHPFSF
jgi:hypothetical protein